MRTFLPANRVLCLICASRQSVIRTSGPQRQRRTLVNTAQAKESQLHSTASSSSASTDQPPPTTLQHTTDAASPNVSDASRLRNEGGSVTDRSESSMRKSPSISDATISSQPNHVNKKKSRRKGNPGSKAIDADSHPDTSSRGAAPPPPRKEPEDGSQQKSTMGPSKTFPTTKKVQQHSVRSLKDSLPNLEMPKVDSKPTVVRPEVAEMEEVAVKPRKVEKLVEEVLKHTPGADNVTRKKNNKKAKKRKDAVVLANAEEKKAKVPSKILFRFEIKPAPPNKDTDEASEIEVHHTSAPGLESTRHNAKSPSTAIDDTSKSRPSKPSEGIGTTASPGKKTKEPLEAPALELLERSRQLIESGQAPPQPSKTEHHRPIRVKLWDTVVVKREDPVQHPTLNETQTVEPNTEHFTALNIDPSYKQSEPTQSETGKKEETWMDKPDIPLVDRKLLANVRLALEREGFIPKPTPEDVKTPEIKRYKRHTSGLYRKQRDYDVPAFPSFEPLPDRLFFPWARRSKGGSTTTDPSDQSANNAPPKGIPKMTDSDANPALATFSATLEQARQETIEEHIETQTETETQSSDQALEKPRGIPVSQILSSLPSGEWTRSRPKGKRPDIDFKGRVQREPLKGPELRLVKAVHDKNLKAAIKALFDEDLLKAPKRNLEDRVHVARRIKDLIKEEDPGMDANTYVDIMLRLAAYGGVTYSHYWECFRKIITTTDDSELLEKVLLSGVQLVPGFFMEPEEGEEKPEDLEMQPEESLDEQKLVGAELLLGLDKELGLESPKSEADKEGELEAEDMTPEEREEAARNKRIYDPKLMIPLSGADNKYKENFWVLLVSAHARLKRRGYTSSRLERFEDVLSRLRLWPTNDNFKWVISRFDIPDTARVEWWDMIVWFNRTMLVRGDHGLRRKMNVMVKNRHAGPIEDLYAFLRNEESTRDRMTDFHYALFVSAFFTCREPHRGMEVLNDMIEAIGTPSQNAFNMMMLGCSRGQDMIALHDVWTKMLLLGQVPSQFCWTTRIHGYFLAGQPQNGMAVLKEMESYGETAGIGVVNAIVDGLLRHHFYNEALKIFQKSLESGIEPNLWSYNTLIRGFICEGKVEETPILLEQMKQHGLYPDVISFSMILAGLASTRGSAFSIDFLYPYLEGMREQGHEANVQTYTCLLNALLRRDDIPSAKKVLELMGKNNIKKNAYTFTILVQYFAKIGRLDAMEEIWKTLKNDKIRPDMITYQLTVEAFAKTIRRTLEKPPWEAQRMMYWLQEMIRVPINPRMGTFVAVLKRLITEGLYEDAKALVDLVTEMRGRVVIDQREGWVAGSYAHFEFWDIAEKMGWAPRLQRTF